MGSTAGTASATRGSGTFAFSLVYNNGNCGVVVDKNRKLERETPTERERERERERYRPIQTERDRHIHRERLV
jgi:hypothetical protein